MSLMTLRAIEHGHSGVTIGAYAAVMQVLQLEQGLALLAENDPTGRLLQDKALQVPRPRRARKAKSTAPPAASSTSSSWRKDSAGPTTDSDAVSSDDLSQLLQLDKLQQKR